MFRKSMLALAAVTAIFGAAALNVTDASAKGGGHKAGGFHGKGGGWHGKHGGHGHRRHGFGGFYADYGYADCGYFMTPRGFMKYVCY